jgi:hypothetical protein
MILLHCKRRYSLLRMSPSPSTKTADRESRAESHPRNERQGTIVRVMMRLDLRYQARKVGRGLVVWGLVYRICRIWSSREVSHLHAMSFTYLLTEYTEMEAEDGLERRDDIRFARKIDRKEQKAALDELVPRAEAGTRERQLEKKKEVNEKMKSFREKSPGAAEVPDTELMGGGDGIEGYKKQKQEFERKKNERELRKEEILRARMAEREERLQEYRAKEEGTMSMLKQLAKQRFG